MLGLFFSVFPAYFFSKEVKDSSLGVYFFLILVSIQFGGLMLERQGSAY